MTITIPVIGDDVLAIATELRNVAVEIDTPDGPVKVHVVDLKKEDVLSVARKMHERHGGSEPLIRDLLHQSVRLGRRGALVADVLLKTSAAIHRCNDQIATLIGKCEGLEQQLRQLRTQSASGSHDTTAGDRSY